MCTYGAGCTRPNCIYRHPPKGVVPKTETICVAYLAGFCQFGERCTNIHPPDEEAETLRTKYARKVCEWGVECRNKLCLYQHPQRDDEDQVVDMLTRVRLHPGSDSPGKEGVAGMPSLPGGVWQEDLCDPGLLIAAAQEGQLDDLSELENPDVDGSESWVYTSGLAGDVLCMQCGADSEGCIDENDGCFYCERCWDAFELQSDAAIHRCASDAGSSAAFKGEDDHPGARAAALPAALPYAPSGPWASVANRAASSTRSTRKMPKRANGPDSDSVSYVGPSREVVTPSEVYVHHADDSPFSITDPMARFDAVNAPYRARNVFIPLMFGDNDELKRRHGTFAGGAVLDLHFQSTSTAPQVLDVKLPELLRYHDEVWIVTGVGIHVPKGSHQRRGGVLRSTVEDHLAYNLLPTLQAEGERLSFHPTTNSNRQLGGFLVRRRVGRR